MGKIPISSALLTKTVQSLVENKVQPVLSTLKGAHDIQQLKKQYSNDPHFVARTQYFYQVKQYSREKYHEQFDQDNGYLDGPRKTMPQRKLDRIWRSPAQSRR